MIFLSGFESSFTRFDRLPCKLLPTGGAGGFHERNYPLTETGLIKRARTVANVI